MRCWFFGLFVFLVISSGSSENEDTKSKSIIPCTELHPGQYFCAHPDIDPQTQQPVGCKENNLAPANCTLSEGLSCAEADNGTFRKEIPCVFTSGKRHRTALLLSIFLGWLGIDRFYLGYPAIGLFKLFTFGFLLIFYVIDIILIALQIVGPADGTGYVIDFYGARASAFRFNNETFINSEEF